MKRTTESENTMWTSLDEVTAVIVQALPACCRFFEICDWRSRFASCAGLEKHHILTKWPSVKGKSYYRKFFQKFSKQQSQCRQIFS